MRRGLQLVGALAGLCSLLSLICVWAGSAGAAQQARLSVSLTPKILGLSTTITFGFEITGQSAQLPSPLVSLDLHLPAGMNIATSTLGLASCDPTFLLNESPSACPTNSLVGFGTGFVEIPFEHATVQEPMRIVALFGPSNAGKISVLFYAEGIAPIAAQLVFPGLLLPDTGPFSAQLDTQIPLLQSVPEGPAVSIVRLKSTIGPRGLLYFRDLHGKRVPYHPRGINVPSRCPRGGFLFAADFGFADGSSTRAIRRVSCPTIRSRPPKRAPRG